jgi:hypothetical protein
LKPSIQTLPDGGGRNDTRISGNRSKAGTERFGEFYEWMSWATYFVNHRDLPSLLRATSGRVKDWDEFTHLILEDEFWSQNWQKMQVDDRSLVYDSSGVYFQGTDAEGFVYLAAPLVITELLWEEVRAAIA